MCFGTECLLGTRFSRAKLFKLRHLGRVQGDSTEATRDTPKSLIAPQSERRRGGESMLTGSVLIDGAISDFWAGFQARGAVPSGSLGPRGIGLDRMARLRCPLEGLIVPSAADPNGHNLLVFPENLDAGSTATVLHADRLS